ncbi:hypothetical protein HMPREF1625_01401 [Staphylococcus aureus 880]|nr:hypothetical protein HMPREF1625_01401 [Staphylococcus aureus 880]
MIIICYCMRFELLIKQLVLLNDTMKRYSILVYCNTKGDLKWM